MEEGNGSKVVIGCCSAVAVLAVAAALSLFVFGKKGFEWFNQASEDQRQSMEALGRWESALSAAGGDVLRLSPEQFAGFERTAQKSDAGAPGLNLGKAGQLDTYSSGAKQLTVWIAAVSDLESEAIIDRIKAQNSDRFSNNSNASFVSNGSGRLSFKGSPPEEQGLLVSANGWAVLLQANDQSLDLKDLLIRYTKAATLQVPPAEPPSVNEPAPKPQPETGSGEIEAETAPGAAEIEATVNGIAP